MRTLLSPVAPVLLPVLALGALALASVGCSDDSSPSPSHDSGVDSSAPVMDASTPVADAAPPGTDADAGICAFHLPAGFTSVVGSASDGDLGKSVSMALDENDDPLFAYLVYKGNDAALTFVRWDPCVGAFTAPAVIDDAGEVNDGHGERQVSIAYDPSTKEVAIAYQKIIADPGENDAKTIWLATRQAGSTSFATQMVSEGVKGDAHGTESPSLAMNAGKLYLGYWQNNYNCGGTGGGCAGVWFLESGAAASEASDAGVSDAAVGDGGAAAAHSFSHTALLYGNDVAQARSDSLSVAVDSAGVPAVAFYLAPATAYNTSLVYWHKGMTGAVLVTDTKNVQNDSVDVSLRFDGLKPRIAGHLVADDPADYDLTYVESDNGSTWFVPVHLPEDGHQGTAFTSALALDGAGNVAVAADTNSGSGDNVCGNPFLARSSNGSAWTACGADTGKTHEYSVDDLNAAFGSARLKGKLTLAFQNSSTEGADQAGVVYWQDK